MSYQNLEIEGIKKIRSGMLIYIVADLLGFFLALILFAVFLLITGIIELLALLRLRDGFGLLVSANRDVGIGRTGTTLILVGTILEIIAALFALVSLLAAIPLLIVAAILSFIGTILLGIGLYKVGSIYQDTLTKVGSIVFILGSILFISLGVGAGSTSRAFNLLEFIGVILVYVGTGHILQKLSSYATAGATPSYAPTGPAGSTQNFIRGNGIATLTFYSQYQGTILSVQILGTQYITAAATPNTVGIGNNAITVNFNGPVSLSPGMTYTVRINLSNGAFVDVLAVYQP